MMFQGFALETSGDLSQSIDVFLWIEGVEKAQLDISKSKKPFEKS